MPFPSEEERVGLTCKLCSQVTGAEDMAYSLLAGGEVPWWVLLVATRSRAQGGEEGRSPSPCRAARRSSEGKGRKGAMVLEWGGGQCGLQLQVRKGIRSRDSTLGHPWVQGSLPIAEAHAFPPKRARQRTSQH